MLHTPLLLLTLLPQAHQTPHSGLYEADGDYIGAPAPGSGSRAAGDVMQTIQGAYSGGNAGMARRGNTLGVFSDEDGLAILYILDEATGATLNTFPVFEDNYFGVGYDASRDLWVLANPSTGLIDTYDGVTGGAVGSFNSPTTYAVGACWDSTRDVYWISDWNTNMLTAMDPVTGAVVGTLDAGAHGADRLSDTAYDPLTDQVLVGARQQGDIFVLDAATGALADRFDAQGQGGFFGNDPSGLCISSSGNLWQSRAANDQLHELELDHPLNVVLALTGSAGGPVIIDVSGATPGGTIAFAYGLAGSFAIPGGPCGGLVLDITNPTVAGTFPATASGTLQLTPTVPAALGGMTLQAVDMASCSASNTQVL